LVDYIDKEEGTDETNNGPREDTQKATTIATTTVITKTNLPMTTRSQHEWPKNRNKDNHLKKGQRNLYYV